MPATAQDCPEQRRTLLLWGEEVVGFWGGVATFRVQVNMAWSGMPGMPLSTDSVSKLVGLIVGGGPVMLSVSLMQDSQSDRNCLEIHV